MAEPFLGQLLLVPYNFAPRAWAFCQGQLLPISQNTALFSLLGTTYGGDGKTTFALPNLQGAIPIGAGQGPGLQLYDLGENGGASSITLTRAENPQHNHTPFSVSGRGFAPSSSPVNNALADGATDYAPANSTLNAQLAALPIAGGSQPHNNMMPYLTLNWIIAMQGIFPPRS